jgi:malonyl-CoA decarboxylase|tara:strand:- start:550 stop:1851 length:1302 start_codon:yes stop_codon:yes gene_type:complete
MRFLQSMLTALVNSPLRITGRLGRTPADDEQDIESALAAVMSAPGAVSSLIYAERFLGQVEALDADGLSALIRHIAATYDIDATALANAARHYGSEPDAGSLAQIATFAEPRWQELFRRLNGAENGTVRLVRLRERLQVIVNKDSDPAQSDAARIDAGLSALLRMWFNPGFLVLQPIDWSTPANILEKIIAYEAVHEITSWDALRARLAPEDRRCFAFFHPRMPEEPLIFVEVALTDHTPASIEDVLQIERQALSPDDASTAVFYSISNCQAGLAGISFGNFLIKRVAQELRLEHPALTTFVTLSPVPGLMRWLGREAPDLAEQFAADDWPADADSLEPAFTAAALRYFTRSDRPDGWPNDPVARFHLGNGAILEQINYGADKSPKGLAQSGGLMVNYQYDLDVVEANHEAFHETKSVLLSPALKTAMKSAKS